MVFHSFLLDEVLSKGQIVLTMLTDEAVQTWSGTLRRPKDLHRSQQLSLDPESDSDGGAVDMGW